MSDVTDERVAQLLRQLLVPDTNAVRNAQEELREMLKSPAMIVTLLGFLTGHPDIEVRQLSVVLLRYRITVHLIKFSEADQEQIKQTLLQAIMNEPQRVVRNGIANTIAHLAKSMIANQQGWPQLPQMVGQLAQDSNPAAREVAYVMLELLAEKAPDFIKADLQAVAGMVMQGLHENELNVKAAAIKAANALLLDADDNTMEVLQPFAAPIVQSLPALCDEHTDVAVEALEVLQECMSRAVPVLNDHFQTFVPMLVEYMTGDHEMSLKQAANNLLISIAEFRPKLLAKKGLVNGLIEACFHMMASVSGVSAAGALFNQSADGLEVADEDDADDEDYARQNMAQTLLDQIAIRVPTKHIYPVCSTMCAQCLQSPEPNIRRTAVAVLGVIAEGCRVPVQEDLENILPALLNTMNDGDQGVRECLGFTLGQFAEHCQPEILSYHEIVLPAAGQLLLDDRITVQAAACYVLEQFLENLHSSSVVQYSQDIAARLMQLSQSPSMRVRSVAFGALSSVAICLEAGFTPYLADTARIIEEVLFVTEPHLYTLRGRALELLGHIALAVGKEAFSPYCELGMRSCSQAVQLDDEDLSEFTHVFVSNAAKVMGGDFAGYLPELVPYLLDAANRSEVSHGLMQAEDDIAGLNEDEEDDEYAYIDLRPAFINFKRSAITSIGALARHTGRHFERYLEDGLNVVAAQLTAFHQHIRAEVASALPELLSCAIDCHGPASVAHGELVQLHPVVAGIVDKMMPLFLSCIKDDLDLLPVTHAMAAVEEVLKLVGRAALKTCQDDLMNLLLAALQGQLAGQLILLEEDHEHDDDEEDLEEDLMNALHDLIGASARALGADFIPYFDAFFQHILQAFRPNRPWVERAIAIGCLAESAEGIGNGYVKYADETVQAIEMCLGDEMSAVRRNASFAAGMFCTSLGAAATSYFPRLLQALHAVCQRRTHTAESSAADTDNALAAVARMIIAAPESVPLNVVLPVFFENLPLTSDLVEYPAVLQCIAMLIQNGDATLLAHVPAVLGVVAHVVHPNTTEIPDALKNEAVHLLHLLGQSQPQLLQQALAQAPEDVRQVVSQHM